jgi:hypothetical protein
MDRYFKDYLRLLGRTKELEKLREIIHPAKIADAELAKGWIVLRNARYPKEGMSQIG